MTDASAIKIYVDIDSLVDLRASTVGLLSEEGFSKLAVSDYRFREIDSIWKYAELDETLYREAYKNKDKEMLTRGTVTEIPLVLSSIVEKINESRVEDVTVGEPEITINYHPFTMSEEERTLLTSAISCYVGTHIKISTISIPPAVITPGYIKNNWNIVLMYDFIGWLHHHHEVLPKDPIPDTTFYVPRLREDTGKTLEEYISEAELEERHKKAFEELDPFDGLRMLLASVLDVNWMDSTYFSEMNLTEADFNPPPPA